MGSRGRIKGNSAKATGISNHLNEASCSLRALTDSAADTSLLLKGLDVLHSDRISITDCRLVS
jgi:hypothetical protein